MFSFTLERAEGVGNTFHAILLPVNYWGGSSMTFMADGYTTNKEDGTSGVHIEMKQFIIRRARLFSMGHLMYQKDPLGEVTLCLATPANLFSSVLQSSCASTHRRRQLERIPHVLVGYSLSNLFGIVSKGTCGHGHLLLTAPATGSATWTWRFANITTGRI